jgi:hypothetical protein
MCLRAYPTRTYRAAPCRVHIFHFGGQILPVLPFAAVLPQSSVHFMHTSMSPSTRYNKRNRKLGRVSSLSSIHCSSDPPKWLDCLYHIRHVWALSIGQFMLSGLPPKLISLSPSPLTFNAAVSSEQCEEEVEEYVLDRHGIFDLNVVPSSKTARIRKRRRTRRKDLYMQSFIGTILFRR